MATSLEQTLLPLPRRAGKQPIQRIHPFGPFQLSPKRAWAWKNRAFLSGGCKDLVSLHITAEKLTTSCGTQRIQIRMYLGREFHVGFPFLLKDQSGTCTPRPRHSPSTRSISSRDGKKVALESGKWQLHEYQRRANSPKCAGGRWVQRLQAPMVRSGFRQIQIPQIRYQGTLWAMNVWFLTLWRNFVLDSEGEGRGGIVPMLSPSCFAFCGSLQIPPDFELNWALPFLLFEGGSFGYLLCMRANGQILTI